MSASNDKTIPLQLFATDGCHLCEQAQALITSVTGQSVSEIEIAYDDALLERYGVRIPVLQRLDNNAELDWPFDAAHIVAFLTQN